MSEKLTCHLRWCDGRRCTCGYADQCESELAQLREVAVAAKALVNDVTVGMYALSVPEPLVVALETALAAAGYDMTEAEFAEKLNAEKYGGPM